MTVRPSPEFSTRAAARQFRIGALAAKNARKMLCPRSNSGRYFYAATQHARFISVLLNK
jgi:hypothetical protein